MSKVEEITEKLLDHPKIKKAVLDEVQRLFFLTYSEDEEIENDASLVYKWVDIVAPKMDLSIAQVNNPSGKRASRNVIITRGIVCVILQGRVTNSFMCELWGVNRSNVNYYIQEFEKEYDVYPNIRQVMEDLNDEYDIGYIREV